MELTFELEDADGQGHVYTYLPHNPTDGERIMYTLAAAGAEPIAAAVIGIFASGSGLDASAETLADAMDWQKLARAIRSTIGRTNMVQLRKDLMATTLRDGQQLKDPAVFNAAYSRNYMEMGRALFEIIKAGRFFTL